MCIVASALPAVCQFDNLPNPVPELSLLARPGKFCDLQCSIETFRRPAHDGLESGDFDCCFSLLDNRQLLIIGDVVGHGTRAAGTARKLKANIHNWVHGPGSPILRSRAIGPAEILRQLDSVITPLIAGEPGRDILPLAVAIIDLEHALVPFGGSGFPDAVLINDSGNFKIVSANGTPIGYTNLEPRHPSIFEETQVPIIPGSTFIMATDGLGESPVKNDSRYRDFMHAVTCGDEDGRLLLRECKSAKTALDHIISVVDLDRTEFCDNSHREPDDVTIIAVHFSLSEVSQPISQIAA